jgi:DNA-binding beta-propeller fold protein YncE
MAMNRIALQIIAIVIAALTLVNCAEKPCVFGSAATERQPLFRAPKAATTGVCPTNSGGGGGGGGGNNGCSSTLTPADVLFGQASTGAITTLAINTGGKNLSLMCTTATAGLGQIVVANVSATNKNFLYVLSVATNAGIRTGTLRGFAIGHVTPVTLTPVGTDLTLSGSNVLQIAEMQADPAGRFITVTDSTLNFVHVLLIDPNSGVLTEAPGSPLTVTNALFTAVDTTGKFLYVTDNPDGEIFIFTIDLVNPMLQITNSPFLVSITPANLPISMLVSGSFLYTANDQSISFFAIGADGSLSPVGSNLVTPVPTFNPQLLALDPTGRFLYVTGSGTEGVLGYSINSSTGALTIIPGGPFAAGSNVTDILPNPVGGQMYLLNAGVIEVFTVDPNSGALMPAAGASQFASSSNLATANVQ